MLGWLARMFLLRILPRKLLPVLTAIEVFRFLRSAQRKRAAGGAPMTGPGPGSGTRTGPESWNGPGPRVVGSSGPEPVADAGGARVGR